MDLPLTFLNLYLLWKVEPGLIQSPLFLTSLIINVFSAGKISTLIEYHLELRQRKRKLERLLLVGVMRYLMRMSIGKPSPCHFRQALLPLYITWAKKTLDGFCFCPRFGAATLLLFLLLLAEDYTSLVMLISKQKKA